MDYIEFLKGKIKLAEFGGFEVADSDINPILKPHLTGEYNGQNPHRGTT